VTRSPLEHPKNFEMPTLGRSPPSARGMVIMTLECSRAVRAMIDCPNGPGSEPAIFVVAQGARELPACEGQVSAGRVSCAGGGWPALG